MENRYSGREVVEMGIIIEQNGRDFYDALIELSDDSSVKITFEYLAKEEEKHIHYFEAILDKVQESIEVEGVNEEFYSYVNQLASQHVFTDRNKGREAAQEVKTPHQAIDLAIRFEKESIQLFEAMRKVVPEKSVVIVNTLVEEEQRHLQKLLDLKATVS